MLKLKSMLLKILKWMRAMANNNPYPFIHSPNYGDRRNHGEISMLVQHYTVTNFQDTKKIFLDTAKQVSAHFVIDTDGKIYQFVDEKKRAWHAGISYFDGIKDVNSYSIGIEIVNCGYDPEKYPIKPYPEAQMRSVINLSKELVEKYNIPNFRIVGHSDIAPNRKIDPGPHFPWEILAENDIGLFPTAEDIAKQNPENVDIQELFSYYGYSIENLKKTQRAFQLHYNPKSWINKAPFDDYDTKILMALCELKKATNNII